MNVISRAVWVIGLAGPGIFISAGRGQEEDAASVPPGVAAIAQPGHHEVLVQAIRERRLLHFTYGGHARVVEPYAYGVSATGEVVLHGYQIAGGSNSAPPPGWRTFAAGQMSEVVLTGRRAAKVREDFSTESPKLDPQWAAVEPPEEVRAPESP